MNGSTDGEEIQAQRSRANKAERTIADLKRRNEQLASALSDIIDAYKGRFLTPRGLVGPIDPEIEAGGAVLAKNGGK